LWLLYKIQSKVNDDERNASKKGNKVEDSFIPQLITIPLHFTSQQRQSMDTSAHAESHTTNLQIHDTTNNTNKGNK